MSSTCWHPLTRGTRFYLTCAAEFYRDLGRLFVALLPIGLIATPIWLFIILLCWLR